MANPDNEEIVRCVAVALYYHIQKGQTTDPKNLISIFNEEIHPITPGKLDLVNPPEAETIYKFLSAIFRAEKLPVECGILCLAYIERILGTPKVTICSSNWRRIILSSLILASKVWEDQAVWNVDFLNVFPTLSVGDLNLLEKETLDLLQYNVSMHASMYAKYYFELRDLSDLPQNAFPLKPLDKEKSRLLEERSQGIEKQARSFQRSASIDGLQNTLKSPPIIIS